MASLEVQGSVPGYQNRWAVSKRVTETVGVSESILD
jgi:hypothetical protein